MLRPEVKIRPGSELVIQSRFVVAVKLSNQRQIGYECLIQLRLR